MGDLISKQSVLNTIYFADKFLDVERTVENYKELITEGIKWLPIDENKGEDRPQGHWINNHNNTISCDRCHTWFNKDDRYKYMRYCPYCNAEMSEIPTGTEKSEQGSTGDMIMALFPMEGYYGKRAKDYYHYIGWNFPKWWNAPYKAKSEDKG